MKNLDDISTETFIARGKYSTLNAELKEQVKRLSISCETMMHATQQILKRSQDDDVDEALPGLLGNARKSLETMETLSKEIIELTSQKNELKSLAWPK
jgi:hypothetical protein